MMRVKYLLIIMVVLSTIIMFTSCQKEPTPLEPQDVTQQELSKFSIPQGATFVSATFNIHIWWFQGIGDPGQDIDVHRITAPWDEMVVTWNNFGSSFAPEIEGSFNAATLGWYSVDVTSLVGSWLDGTNANYGLLLDEEIITGPRSVYNSRENAADHPYLEICYNLNGTTVYEQVEPFGDTYIHELFPDNNNGANTNLYTGWYTPIWDKEKQALLIFDLEPTPPPQVDCETAYAYGDNLATCFLDIPGVRSNNWGWTNFIGEGSYDWPIYAGAGLCDISKGTLVGNLSVEYFAGTVTITYELDPGFDLDETHVWVGTTPLPIKRGKYTTAPGQFNHNGENPVVVSGLSGNIYIAAHSGVCWEVVQ